MNRSVAPALLVTVAVLWAVGCTEQKAAFRGDADVTMDLRADAGIDGIDGIAAIDSRGRDDAETSDAEAEAPATAAVDAEAADAPPPAPTDGSTDAAAAEAGTPDCARFCARINALACPSDDPMLCVGQCERVVATPPCGQTYSQLVACGADRPASDFHCDTGNGTINDSVCADQAQAFADCLLFGP